MNIFDVTRRLGPPSAILVVPAPDVARYSISFFRNVLPHELENLREFLTQHDSIDDVEQSTEDDRTVIVSCAHDDQGYQTLLWLQTNCLPHRSFTTIAQLFTSALPLVARLAIIGRHPDDHVELLEGLNEHAAIQTAQYDSTNDQVVVIFNQGVTEDEAAFALETLPGYSCRVMRDNKKKPLIQLHFGSKDE